MRLDEDSPEAIEAVWIEEAKRRIAAIRSGETELELRRHLARRR